MSSPIAFREFSEDEYRRFVQTLSDEELIKAGKRLRILSGDGKIVTTTPCVFDQQLRFAGRIAAETSEMIRVFRLALYSCLLICKIVKSRQRVNN